jgi:hypothetical protein
MTPPAVLDEVTAPAEDATRAPRAQRLRARVSWIVIFIAVATIAVGVTVHHTTGRLGTALPPFVAGWAPRAELLPALIAAATLGAAAVVVLPRLVEATVAPWQFDIMVLLVALATGLALGAAREGTHGWWAIFDLSPRGSFEARNEYLPGLPTLSYGVHVYLDRFAELVPSQPVNVAGHPPGPLLLAHALGIRTAQGLAALCVAGAAACAPLTHRLARALHGDDRAARTAGALCAMSPIVLLFGFTSYDAVFAAAGTATALLLVTPRTRPLGALALALAAFLSWALLAVGAWAAFVAWRREGTRAALVLATMCAAALVALNIILAAASGYDPVGTLRATEQVYRDSVSQQRPLWFWAFGSPVAWGVLLGPPIVAGLLRSATAARATGLATVIVIAIAAGGGFTKAETERIWLFLVPLACVAAAPHVSPRRLTLVLGTLAAQALAIQLLMGTVW